MPARRLLALRLLPIANRCLPRALRSIRMFHGHRVGDQDRATSGVVNEVAKGPP